MSSLILRTTLRLILPILLLYSVFLFLRGHNYSGGGFVGGLVAAAGLALYALAYRPEDLKDLIKVEFQTLMVVGLTIALLAGVIPLFDQQNFLTGKWLQFHLPRFGEIHLGTPLLFDLGVYLAVIGTALTILTNLMEE